MCWVLRLLLVSEDSQPSSTFSAATGWLSPCKFKRGRLLDVGRSASEFADADLIGGSDLSIWKPMELSLLCDGYLTSLKS